MSGSWTKINSLFWKNTFTSSRISTFLSPTPAFKSSGGFLWHIVRKIKGSFKGQQLTTIMLSNSPKKTPKVSPLSQPKFITGWLSATLKLDGGTRASWPLPNLSIVIKNVKILSSMQSAWITWALFTCKRHLWLWLKSVLSKRTVLKNLFLARKASNYWHRCSTYLSVTC